MKRQFIVLGGVLLFGNSTPAFGQSSNYERERLGHSAEARVSLTIPLGRSADKTKMAPRLKLGIINYETESSLGTDWLFANKKNYRDVTLGFTLETKPKVMMNEQVLIFPADDKTNIGTAGKIGIGVAVVAAVGLAVVATIFATTDFAEDA